MRARDRLEVLRLGMVVHIRHEEDAAGPRFLGGQHLTPLGRGLAHDEAIEPAIGVVLARLVVEDQDDLAPDVHAPVIVMTAFGGLDAEADEGDMGQHFPLSGWAERHRHELLAGAQPASSDSPSTRPLDGPRLVVTRLNRWKCDPSPPMRLSPSRSNREAMNSEANSFSGVAVNRPRNRSLARKNRSALISRWQIESFLGAVGSAPGRNTISSVVMESSVPDMSSSSSVRLQAGSMLPRL